jgi:2-succinyl-5-enolpyruvyl-6-hydroxy-3-cyclohexene-1-carboxylate synthase
MLLHAHAAIRVWMHVDERSAAYFALGMAKASRRPVVLLATSGTAALNFAPAVAEARYGRVPLIVLTADRPPELRELGAPQTIDQMNLYGRHAKWWLEMPLPEATDNAARHARMAAARAAAIAQDPPAGPVHLNVPLREPLIPSLDRPRIDDGQAPSEIGVVRASRRFTAGELAPLAEELGRVPDGIIVCGPQDDGELPWAAAGLATVLGYPLLADPLSLVRCGSHDRSLVIDAYDAFLRDEETAERLRPGVILRLGALPTSKPLFQFMRRRRDARQIVVDAGGWPDPILSASDVYRGEATSFCRALTAALGQCRAGNGRADVWRAISSRTRAAIDSRLGADAAISEPAVFADLAALLPDGATLYAGNSMPVRDLDSFFPAGERSVRFLANRGANGIDGVLSSALGASAAASGPHVLVIGDLSFYHDMNGLLAAKRHGLSATIVLVNNDGGGIFSFLPQAEHPEQFEELFGTPHGLDFRPACELYGAGHELPQSREEFREAVSGGLSAPGVQVIEVRTDRTANAALHRDLWRIGAAASGGAG